MHFIRKASILKYSLLILCCLVAGLPVRTQAQAWSGIISTGRAIDWSTAGVPGGIPGRTTICANISASTYGNGADDATAAIQAAMNSCGSGQVVLLSSGTFLIRGSLTVPGNVSLRGAGASQTILQAHGTSGSVVALGSQAAAPSISPSVAIVSGSTAGSTSIGLSSASGISVGSYLMISELNDPSFVTIVGDEGSCTWCDGGIGWNGTRAAGQIVEVTSVSGNTVAINPGLFITYSLTPLATPFTASAKYAGVENLQVYANNTGYGSNFEIDECAYCWIEGVEGNYADGDHVDVDWSYHSEITNSYFSNAYVHTPGNHDSDVAVRNKSTGLLIQNNILERLHTSIMLEWGASGNVMAYNYMLGAFDSGAPNATAVDLSIHGAHPSFNLWEGNTGASIKPDSVWGSNSANTAYRNWMKGTQKVCNPLTGRGTVVCTPMGAQGDSGINGSWAIQTNRALDINALSSNYNIVGNVLGSATASGMTFYNNGQKSLPQTYMVVAICGPSPCGPISRSYDDAVYSFSLGFSNTSDTGSNPIDSLIPYSTLLNHGNYSSATSAVAWASTLTHTLPPSLYLSSKPAWFGSTPFPAIGPDVSGGLSDSFGNAYAIPAVNCYQSVMGGTDSSNSPLRFDSASCYGGSSNPAPPPPTNVSATVQ
jgi:hypothetical protein